VVVGSLQKVIYDDKGQKNGYFWVRRQLLAKRGHEAAF